VPEIIQEGHLTFSSITESGGISSYDLYSVVVMYDLLVTEWKQIKQIIP
jgi:hypothetical protein